MILSHMINEIIQFAWLLQLGRRVLSIDVYKKRRMTTGLLFQHAGNKNSQLKCHKVSRKQNRIDIIY